MWKVIMLMTSMSIATNLSKIRFEFHSIVLKTIYGSIIINDLIRIILFSRAPSVNYAIDYSINQGLEQNSSSSILNSGLGASSQSSVSSIGISLERWFMFYVFSNFPDIDITSSKTILEISMHCIIYLFLLPYLALQL